MSEERLTLIEHPLQTIIDRLYVHSYNQIPSDRVAAFVEEFDTPEDAGKFYLEYHPSLAGMVIPTYQEVAEEFSSEDLLSQLPQEFLDEYQRYLDSITHLSAANSQTEILDADLYRTNVHNKLATSLQVFFGLSSFEVARALVKVLLIESGVESVEEVSASIDRRLSRLYGGKR